MHTKRILYSLLFFCLLGLSASAGPIKKVLKLIEKQKYEKAEKTVLRKLSKDSLNSGMRYAYARLWVTPDYPEYHIDSAHRYIIQAQSDWAISSEKMKKKMKKDGLDSLGLQAFKQQVDSLAFARAQAADTLAAYQYFLDEFSDALEYRTARALRDERAYQIAKRENTYESYLYFLRTYPDAQQAKDAREFYDILLFEEKIRDKKLASFRQFLQEYPNTPYRKEAEWQILQISTASNTPESFQAFMKSYPNSEWRSKVLNRLYWAYKAEGKSADFVAAFPSEAFTDSLVAYQSQVPAYSLPIREKGKYAYMKENGELLTDFRYTQIPEEDLCGALVRDFSVVQSEEDVVVLNRAGKEVITGDWENITVLNEAAGIFALSSDQGDQVYRVGEGLLELPMAHQVRSLGNHYLALQTEAQGKWAVYSLGGHPLLSAEWDSLHLVQEQVWLRKQEHWTWLSRKELEKVADGNLSPWGRAIDRFSVFEEEYVVIEQEGKKGLLNAEGELVFSAKWESLARVDDRWMARDSLGFQFFSTDGKTPYLKNLSQWAVNSLFMIAQSQQKWTVLTRSRYDFPSFSYDSAQLLGEHFVWLATQDSTWLLFEGGRKLPLSAQDKIRVRRPNQAFDGEVEWIEVQNSKGYIRVFDQKGQEILNNITETPLYLAEQAIVADKKGKKGLIDGQGQSLVPMKYEAIGNYREGMVSLLLNKQFGAYLLTEKKLIPTQYERLLKAYTATVLLAAKGGKWGFITSDNQPLSEFSFDEVHYWTDSVALVRNDEAWSVYDFYEDDYLYEDIENFHFIRQSAEENVLQILTPSGYGIYSSLHGEVVPPTYNDLLNLGTAEQPLYFAEKHVAEADFYVVLYLNAKGETLHKQVFTPEEYDFIYCDN
ncbi:WG repeat-containing protein [Cytophagales bacterium LB-30]|uniref:WG repeat-containing protein n=1 Tax=Shiella aurantiaca TaxID=3058365 RepID=A0ABT8F909_9BACT|nr:WG repeat-containing protein [Shiella aurantiaca]MDN4166734.1 WG repeat-containing protein [Shiella aurantiaca]